MINPRLTDYLGLDIAQDDVDFLIPRLDEDVPLCIDPFLLFNADTAEYRQLHRQLLAFFDAFNELVRAGDRRSAYQHLIRCKEPPELGLGYALGSKTGSSLGPRLVESVIELFESVPQLEQGNLSHIEAIGLLVPKIAEDRLSDITGVILKDWLIDFSSRRASDSGLPVKQFLVPDVWDTDDARWRASKRASLPFHPVKETPLLLPPLNLLRHLPWINYEDYYKSDYCQYVLPPDRQRDRVPKDVVLRYNQRHYQAVENYLGRKESQAKACRPETSFKPLTPSALRRRLAEMRKLPSGTSSAKRYEQLTATLLSSLLFPHLEHAGEQERTLDGVHIRDLILYNNASETLLAELRRDYVAQQVVFEIKNVGELNTEHVNQIYRYMDGQFGRFGVLVSRRPPNRSVLRNLVDLHSSKRAVVLWLTDDDLDLMVRVLEAGRPPLGVLVRRYIEFSRMLPK